MILNCTKTCLFNKQKKSLKSFKSFNASDIVLIPMPLREIDLKWTIEIHFFRRRVFVFPRPGPGLNLYLTVQAPNLFFKAPALNLYLPVLRFAINKFVVVSVSSYTNHNHKKRKGFPFLMTMCL